METIRTRELEREVDTLRSTLKVISTWAAVDDERLTRAEAMRQIEKKANKALGINKGER